MPGFFGFRKLQGADRRRVTHFNVTGGKCIGWIKRGEQDLAFDLLDDFLGNSTTGHDIIVLKLQFIRSAHCFG